MFSWQTSPLEECHLYWKTVRVPRRTLHRSLLKNIYCIILRLSCVVVMFFQICTKSALLSFFPLPCLFSIRLVKCILIFLAILKFSTLRLDNIHFYFVFIFLWTSWRQPKYLISCIAFTNHLMEQHFKKIEFVHLSECIFIRLSKITMFIFVIETVLTSRSTCSFLFDGSSPNYPKRSNYQG